jgi:peptidoglycan DL-endopeptidase CwlO
MKSHYRKLQALILGLGRAHSGKTRRPRQVAIACESLEDRVTPAHMGIAHNALAHLQAAAHHAHATGTLSTTSAAGSTGTTTAASQSTTVSSSSSAASSSSSSSALSTAEKTLKGDIQTIELASGTTVGQLTAIAVALETLKTDGLSPSSESALKSFENTLVTDYASGTTLTGNATLLSQFEAIYTSSPTTQETTDLTTAYNALAAAVTSSNITSADITTINTDWAAVLAAEGSTSTATFPYFQLVTGQQGFDGTGQGSC